MDADDRTGSHPWSTTSPQHLDQMARGMLRAACRAHQELRRDPPDPARRASALDLLMLHTQAMLGPDLPACPPGTAAQERFVGTALALAKHVRAHSWAEAELGAPSAPGRDDVPHAGEHRMANAFDATGRMMLPHASPEGWAATVATDLARGDKTLETTVKVGKYILHPTPLALADDATRIIGEALHNLNVRRLQELTHSLRGYASATGTSHPVIPAEHGRPSVGGPKRPERPDSEPRRISVGLHRSSVTTPERPDSKPRIRLGVPRSPSTRRPMDSGPVPANPATPVSEEPTWHPSSSPQSSGIPGPHNLW
jgi:hypothetical protein